MLRARRAGSAANSAYEASSTVCVCARLRNVPDSHLAGLLQCKGAALAPSCSSSASNNLNWSFGLVVRAKAAGVDVAGSNPGSF